MSTVVACIGAFLDKVPGIGGSVTSDSRRLLSYGVTVAEWYGGRVRMVRPVRTSRTTARHMSTLRTMAGGLGIDVIELSGQVTKGKV